MSEYIPEPKARSTDGHIMVETLAKKREDGLFVGVIRLIEPKSPIREFEIGLVSFAQASEAHVEAQIASMTYFGVSRADDIWTTE